MQVLRGLVEGMGSEVRRGEARRGETRRSSSDGVGAGDLACREMWAD